jgi:hypothetical protein
MRYILTITILLFFGCSPERADRPLLYKTKLQRVEALHSQNDKALKALDRVNAKADELAEDIREVYRLVVELTIYSSSCLCSEGIE